MKLSDYVIERLAQAGVKHVFIVPGGAAMHLNDSLAGRRDIDFIATFHEHASAVAAEAYAKLTGNLGVALVTAGPGSTNCITGCSSAWVNSAPLIFISGQVKSSDLKTGTLLRQLGLQEIDIISIVKPITKYSVRIIDPTTIRQEMDNALFLAKEGRPGPVWIDIPLDVQSMDIIPDKLPSGNEQATICLSRSNLKEIVSELRRDIEKSSRPVFLFGAGVRIAGAADICTQLADLISIPYTTTWVGADLVHDDHPNFAGRPGAFASRGANFAIQNSDLLISIGARWDFATTGFSHTGFARGAKRIVVDIDKEELKKLQPIVECCIHADAKDFIQELLLQSEGFKKSPEQISWINKIHEWKRRYPIVTKDYRGLDKDVSSYVVMETLSRLLTTEDILVEGSAGIQSEIFFMTFAFKNGQRIIADGSFGSMGYGVPAVIGACVAGGGRRTILIDGDGSLMPNIQELETIHRLGLPIKIIVINNNGYGSIRVSQQRWFHRSIAADSNSGMTFPNLEKIANSYNIGYHYINNESLLEECLQIALNTSCPEIIDVQVPPEEDRIPRLGNYKREDGTMASRALEDMFPFLDRDEFNKNILM